MEAIELVIRLPKKVYDTVMKKERMLIEDDIEIYKAIDNGTPLPEGAEILTAEAYSDLCLRASRERKTGKWFDSVNKWDAMANKHNFFCQECKRFAMYFVSGTEDWWCHEAPNYCPWCGSKMEGAEE